MADDEKTSTLHEVEKEAELRFEVDKDETINVTLVKGTAELFGTELAVNNEYTFTNCKFAIFTWHGCSLEVEGHCRVVYPANETPMVSFINTHAALDNLRKKAQQTGEPGPRALVVGPTDAGKSTLCRILLGYAVRAGWSPTFFDIDVGQNSLTIPGAIAASPINHPISVEDHGILSLKVPIVHFLGATSPTGHIEHYCRLLQNLVTEVDQRCATNANLRASGYIINTCGWVDGEGYDVLVRAANIFKVDVILVLGHERLYSQLKANRAINCSVAKLQTSGGAVTRDQAYRRARRDLSFKEYFYGAQGDLHPHQRVVGFEQVFIYRIGGGAMAPSTALPIGAETQVDPMHLNRVQPSSDLVNSVLALSYGAAYGDPLLDSPAAGFVYIKAVDIRTKKVTMLTPCAGPLPQNFFLIGNLKWFD